MSESLTCTTDDLLVEGPALCVNLEQQADLEGRALVTEGSCALGVPPMLVSCAPSDTAHRALFVIPANFPRA